MMWPRELEDQTSYPGLYQRSLDVFFEEYQTYPWRKRAVRTIRTALAVSLSEGLGEGCPLSEDELRSLLYKGDFTIPTSALGEHEDRADRSVFSALQTDAAVAHFCASPSIRRWKIVGRLIDNDPVASRVATYRFRQRVETRPKLLIDIQQIARSLVRNFNQQPTRGSGSIDDSRLAEMHRRWIEKPDLHDIWFGLRANDYVMPFRSDWHIFDILFELVPEEAAKLLEEYEAPFQPEMILSWGTLDPSRRYSDWRSLMQAAACAFDARGNWNGRYLLPILLRIAQDALRERRRPSPDGNMAAGEEDTPFHDLAADVAMHIWNRTDGAACSLRWGGWLFRSIMGAVDGEQIPFPSQHDSRGYADWLMLNALIDDQNSLRWLDRYASDVAVEDQLCLEGVRILAAQKHESPVPGRALLFELLPSEPEDFLDGPDARRLRELPSLFTTWGKRPDAFGTRILATCLFAGEPGKTFGELWQKTLTLREMTEHRQAYNDGEGYDDRVRAASQTIHFIIALGINLIDYLQDPRSNEDGPDQREATMVLFRLLDEATREMFAIDILGRATLVDYHNHICVRRAIYRESDLYPFGLGSNDQPTVGDLLAPRVETSNDFFSCLQMLIANDIPRVEIQESLTKAGFDLADLTAKACALNQIEAERKIELKGLMQEARKA